MNISTAEIMICDNSENKGLRLAAHLNKMDMYAYTVKNDEKVIFNSIVDERPDIVIAYMTLNNSEEINLIEKIKTSKEISSKFIVITDIHSTFIEQSLVNYGAACVISEPVDAMELYKMIHLILNEPVSKEYPDAEILITDMIRGIGVPAHIKGYNYIRTAVLECINCRNLLENVTKKLYPKVAEIYQTTPARVERAIRHAIETAWDRMDKSTMTSFFGCKVAPYQGRPTNSEFIALTTDKVDLLLKRYDVKKIHTDNLRMKYDFPSNI